MAVAGAGGDIFPIRRRTEKEKRVKGGPRRSSKRGESERNVLEKEKAIFEEPRGPQESLGVHTVNSRAETPVGWSKKA